MPLKHNSPAHVVLKNTSTSSYWTHTFLTAPGVYQCHVTVNGKKQESAQHFSKRIPNFFCTSDIHQTWIQNTFSKQKVPRPN